LLKFVFLADIDFTRRAEKIDIQAAGERIILSVAKFKT